VLQEIDLREADSLYVTSTAKRTNALHSSTTYGTPKTDSQMSTPFGEGLKPIVPELK